MAVNDLETGSGRARAGQKPTRFVINPLGEVIHEWPDGSETGIGSVNITDVARDHGLKNHQHVPQEYIEQAFQSLYYREYADPKERVLHQLWTHLQPLEGYFRFWAEINADGVMRLWMSAEYIVDAHEYAALEAEVLPYGDRRSANYTHIEIHSMWVDCDEPEKTQYDVRFDVLDKSFAEVAMLQLSWLSNQANFLPESKVNIL